AREAASRGNLATRGDEIQPTLTEGNECNNREGSSATGRKVPSISIRQGKQSVSSRDNLMEFAASKARNIAELEK
ncbi:hypothetical protein BGX20_006448, partial [Mortierella sp. AD010]